MRIWDQIHPRNLCRQHLLGEHRELHAIWRILTKDRDGYRHHPEVKRWEGRLGALYIRHEMLVKEIERRGYNHRSPLKGAPRFFDVLWPEPWDDQRNALAAKHCGCEVPA